MPKAPTGEVRCINGTWVARVTLIGRVRPSFAMPWCRDEAAAKQRAQLLADEAKRLRTGSVGADLSRTLLADVATAAPDRTLRDAMLAIGRHVGNAVRPIGVPQAPTFKEVAERWTSGELAKEYPDQIKAKRSVKADASRFSNYIYPIIGDVPIDRLTLDHCEVVMRRLPAKQQVATRRNVAQLMTRLLRLAVYPLRLIAASPIPRGFLPTISRRKAMAYLYPDEERRLMECTQISLEHRLLWGFLAREGMRESEALLMAWSDLDLTRGAVRLDRNKTDDPRAWALDAGVAETLRWYRNSRRGAAHPDERVFVGPNGGVLVGPGLAETLRLHLEKIGLREARPELFTTTPERQRFRVHDLRGTFVTVGLANGRTEAWIADRTGHRSSNMIAKYKRTARTFEELELGELTALNEAIPEVQGGQPTVQAPPPSAAAARAPLRATSKPGNLSIAHGLPTDENDSAVTTRTHTDKALASPMGFESETRDPQPLEFADCSLISPGAGAPKTVICEVDGQSMGRSIEAEIAVALRNASAAGQWHVVELLARQLDERSKRSEKPTDIIDLDTERKRRS